MSGAADCMGAISPVRITFCPSSARYMGGTSSIVPYFWSNGKSLIALSSTSLYPLPASRMPPVSATLRYQYVGNAMMASTIRPNATMRKLIRSDNGTGDMVAVVIRRLHGTRLSDPPVTQQYHALLGRRFHAGNLHLEQADDKAVFLLLLNLQRAFDNQLVRVIRHGFPRRAAGDDHVLDLRGLAEAAGEQVGHEGEARHAVGLVHRDHEPLHADLHARQRRHVGGDVPALVGVVLEVAELLHVH